MEKITTYTGILNKDVQPEHGLSYNGPMFENVVPETSYQPKKKAVKKVSPKKVEKKHKNFKFDFFGDTIEVKFFDKVTNQDGDWIYGCASYDDLTIMCSTLNCSGRPLTENQLKTTIVHEAVHIILQSGQFFAENDNEPLVEWLAKGILSIIEKQNILKNI